MCRAGAFLIELCKLRAANALELRLKRVHRSLILKNDIFFVGEE